MFTRIGVVAPLGTMAHYCGGSFVLALFRVFNMGLRGLGVIFLSENGILIFGGLNG